MLPLEPPPLPVMLILPVLVLTTLEFRKTPFRVLELAPSALPVPLSTIFPTPVT